MRWFGSVGATIPDHNPLRLGTLVGMIKDIAAHFAISEDEVIEKIRKRR